MRGSQFVFDSIDLLCHRLQKIGLKRGVSYTDSFEWLKNKKEQQIQNIMLIIALSLP